LTGRAYFPASKTVEHGSPPDLVAALSVEFGPFELDPAASETLHCAPTWYSRAADGLALPWFGRVWCNPPYGKRVIDPWVYKALLEVKAGRAELVCMLLPSLTSVAWWHDWVIPYAAVIRPVRGRLRFVGAKSVAPFASAIVVFR
jgi:site-specific DNA-methyltransferase (adenine-specific)